MRLFKGSLKAAVFIGSILIGTLSWNLDSTSATMTSCPQYTSPPTGWCTGTIISQGKDVNGCQLPPKCVSGLQPVGMKDIYVAGEKIDITVKNTGTTDYKFWPECGRNYKISKVGGKQVQIDNPMMAVDCIQGGIPSIIKSGETKALGSWDQHEWAQIIGAVADNYQSVQVAAGVYTISALGISKQIKIDTLTVSCPVYSAPPAGWCKDGIIVSQGKDVNGCQLPQICQKDSASCTIQNVYATQAPGYTYSNFFITTRGGMGSGLTLSGADSWNGLTFVIGGVSSDNSSDAIYQASQTLNSTAVAYLLERKNRISAIQTDKSTCAPISRTVEPICPANMPNPLIFCPDSTTMIAPDKIDTKGCTLSYKCVPKVMCPNYVAPPADWCKDGTISTSKDINGCTKAECIPKVSCAVYTAPSADWCKGGTITAQGKDINGCQLSPKCDCPTGTSPVNGTCTRKTPPKICSPIYSPVCARPVYTCSNGFFCPKPDPVTYKNICEMNNAGASKISVGRCKPTTTGTGSISCATISLRAPCGTGEKVLESKDPATGCAKYSCVSINQGSTNPLSRSVSSTSTNGSLVRPMSKDELQAFLNSLSSR